MISSCGSCSRDVDWRFFEKCPGCGQSRMVFGPDGRLVPDPSITAEVSNDLQRVFEAFERVSRAQTDYERVVRIVSLLDQEVSS